MKRPLFCLGMAFALGEAMYIYADKAIYLGAVLAVLVCSAFYFSNEKNRWSVYIFLAGIMLGVLHAFCFSMETLIVEQNICVEAWVVGIESEEKMLVDFCDYDGKAVIQDVRTSEFSIGNRVKITGTIHPYKEGTNPGEFNQQVYYLSRNIIGYFSKPQVQLDIENTNTTWKYRWKKIQENSRNCLLKKSEQILPEAYTGLYQCILLGYKNNLSQDIKKLYQISGMSHVLVISGLHISLIAGCFYQLLRKCHVHFLPAGVGSVVFVLLYGGMTNLGIATVRAICMIVIWMLAESLGDRYDLPTALSIALFFLLFVRPERLLDNSLHLSFGAIFGVSLGQYIIRQLKKQENYRRLRRKHKFLFLICNNLIMTCAISVVMAPIIASVYYEIPTYGFLLNLMVVPTMSLVVVVGLVALAVSLVSLSLAALVIKPGVLCLKVYYFLGKQSLKLPGCFIKTGHVSLLQIIIYYVVILCLIWWMKPKVQRSCREWLYHKTGYWAQRKTWKYVVLGVFGVTFFALTAAEYIIYKTDCYETLLVADVGQGQCILMRTASGDNIVVDGGSVSKQSVGEYTLEPALKYMHMYRVDYWIISHTDEDHISGMLYILKEGNKTGIEVKNIVISENYFDVVKADKSYNLQDPKLEEIIALAKQNHISVWKMEAGDSLRAKECEIRFLHPDKGYVQSLVEGDKNTCSMGFSYRSPQLCAMILGDIDASGLDYMLRENGNWLEKEYDVLLLPHHGSKYSLDSRLYGYLKANEGVAVCSCGRNNRYGHPHSEVLQELKRQGINLYRTDMEGAIEIRGK